MMAPECTYDLVKSELYSEELGIHLEERSDREYFMWFLASVLFGARISETISKRTYRAFVRHHLTTPQRILAAGWNFLVDPVMREGGYVRYDEKTSHEILENCRMLLREYGGSLTHLYHEAKDAHDLERRLLEFLGVGPVTVNIFLRELRPYWRKADPAPLPVVKDLARRSGVDLVHVNRHTMKFARIEAGLVRARHGVRERRGAAPVG